MASLALHRAVHALKAFTCARSASTSVAEHGVGQLRRDELRRYKPAVEYELMMRIKQALDPNHLMNPGKIF